MNSGHSHKHRHLQWHPQNSFPAHRLHECRRVHGKRTLINAFPDGSRDGRGDVAQHNDGHVPGQDGLGSPA